LDAEQTLLKDRERGSHAKRIFDDEVFMDAVSKVRDEIYQAFRVSSLSDDRTRLCARLQIDLLERLLGGLKKIMVDGTIAEHALLKIEEQSKRQALYEAGEPSFDE